MSLGISTDPLAAQGLLAGCDVWYSVLAGTLPKLTRTVSDPAARGDHDAVAAATRALQPLWDLFDRHGSYRVIACVAEHLGLVGPDPLPLPVHGLTPRQRADVAAVVDHLPQPT